MLKSLPEKFHAKITIIEESKDIDSIPLTKLVGNLQTYELDLTTIRKGIKSKRMALKAKSNKTVKSSDNEDSKMKSYIIKQYKKFIKNANAKGFDKDHKQYSSSQFKSQDRGKKDAKDSGQFTIPLRLKCFRCQGFGHMKEECPIYLKTIGKSKALVATLSDTKPEIELDDSDDEGISSAFTATVDPTKRITETEDDEEDLVVSMFEKMDE